MSGNQTARVFSALGRHFFACFLTIPPSLVRGIGLSTAKQGTFRHRRRLHLIYVLGLSILGEIFCTTPVGVGGPNDLAQNNIPSSSLVSKQNSGPF